jgi:hypothetical protein
MTFLELIFTTSCGVHVMRLGPNIYFEISFCCSIGCTQLQICKIAMKILAIDQPRKANIYKWKQNDLKSVNVILLISFGNLTQI